MSREETYESQKYDWLQQIRYAKEHRVDIDPYLSKKLRGVALEQLLAQLKASGIIYGINTDVVDAIVGGDTEKNAVYALQRAKNLSVAKMDGMNSSLKRRKNLQFAIQAWIHWIISCVGSLWW